jgi:hypothetical protein
MQLTAETVAVYKSKAPELMAAVTTGEAEFIMKRDEATDRCVKFESGLCSIHRDYTDAFLGDACHFYPRITRALGGTIITTAVLSCPETARLMLYDEGGLDFTPREEVRVPYSLRNYLPNGLDEATALSIHQAFLSMALDDAVPAEHALMRIMAVAKGLDLQPVTSWQEAIPLYTMLADGRIPAAQPHPADIYNVVHALSGLVRASGKCRPPLQTLMDRLTEKLGMTFDANGGVVLSAGASALAVQLIAASKQQSHAVQPILRRYLAAQISQALFPFSGAGATLSARMTVIGVRFALVKWALATLGEQTSPDHVVPTIQIISRFIDHLADPTLLLAICEETGWSSEARLRALIDDPDV